MNKFIPLINQLLSYFILNSYTAFKFIGFNASSS